MEWAKKNLRLPVKPGSCTAASADDGDDDTVDWESVNQLLDEVEERHEQRLNELVTNMNAQYEQLEMQKDFIGLLESKIGDLSTAGLEWRDFVSMMTEEKKKLWKNINEMRKALQEAQKQNHETGNQNHEMGKALQEAQKQNHENMDNISVMTQKILDLEKKSTTNNCFSGCFNWCR